MAEYLQSRSQEMGHSARMKAVESYFADPSKLQEFASTYQPHQWVQRCVCSTIQYTLLRHNQGPHRRLARVRLCLGRPAVNSTQEPEKRIEQIIDKMGL